MRFLFRLLPDSPDRDSVLGTVRAIARSLGSDARNAKWTSYGALELDAFAPSKADFELLLSAITPLGRVEFYRDLNIAPQFKPEEEQLAEALEYFNAERYWEAHEVLEGLWRTKQGEEKSLLQGMILVCAAFVHNQKGEEEVALSVLARGAKQLSYPEAYYGRTSLAKLTTEVEKILRTKRFENFNL